MGAEEGGGVDERAETRDGTRDTKSGKQVLDRKVVISIIGIRESLSELIERITTWFPLSDSS